MTPTDGRVPLTPRQREVFRAILAHYAETGRTPTVRELADAIGVRSSHAASLHIEVLRRKGWLVMPLDGGPMVRTIAVPEFVTVVQAAAQAMLDEGAVADGAVRAGTA